MRISGSLGGLRSGGVEIGLAASVRGGVGRDDGRTDDREKRLTIRVASMVGGATLANGISASFAVASSAAARIASGAGRSATGGDDGLRGGGSILISTRATGSVG